MEGKDRGGARWRGKGKEGEGPAVRGGILLQGLRGIDAPALHRLRSRLAIGTSRHAPPPQLHRRLDAFCPGTRNINSAPMDRIISVKITYIYYVFTFAVNITLGYICECECDVFALNNH